MVVAFLFCIFASVNRRLEIILAALLMIIALQSSAAGALSEWNISKAMLKEKVTGIAQDERGFLWLSTWGGLFRYDGREFRSFKTHPGDGTHMPYDRLDAVKIDKRGNVWCRSFYHPYCFDVRTSTFIDVTEKLEQTSGLTFSIQQIYPMANGYVWLQTKDGDAAIRVSIDNPEKSARLYSQANGRLKKGKILNINEDSRGMAWILSEGGITVPGLRVSFPNKRFDYWRETAKGRIYLATKGGELWLLNTRAWRMQRVALPIKAGRIFRLGGHSNGELAVATDEALLTWHKGRWKVHRYKGVKEGRIESVKRLFRDEMGCYWMITNQAGAMLLDGINGTLRTLLPDVEGNYENKHDSWFFALQSTTTLLMAKGGGLCHYNGDGGLHHVMQENGEWYQPQVGRTFVDREGNVWLYNSKGGLDRISLRKAPFKPWGMYISPCALFMDSKNRLWVGDTRGKLTVWGREYNLGTVYAIEEMKDGTMWVGTKDRGLYRLTPKNEDGDYRVEQFLHNPNDRYSLSANDVFCMTKDHNGNLWIGTYSGGLNCVLSSQFSVHSSQFTVSSQFAVHSSCAPVGAQAQSGTQSSIFNFQSSKPQFINKNNSLTWLPADERSLNIRSLLCTKEGIMCVGTSKGIYAFKNGNFNANGSTKKVYHNERRADDVHSLSNNEIMMMCQDKRGYVYCLTPSAGICRTMAEALLTDNAVFTVYDKRNLAPSDAPLSITADAHDNLWITYPHSIAMLEGRERTVFYNWQSPPMSFAEIVKDRQGNLVAATTDDIISWNPAALKPDKEASRIAIAALTVEGRQMTYDADLMDTIRLESSERDVSLQLATLTMRQGEEIKYAYRLDGDSTWIMQGNNDRLTFLNMRAGYHTIELRSTNASGVWCNNFRTITIYVKPTFWETPWALLLYILIGVMVMGGIAMVWAYIYRLHLKMRTQEEVIKQRMDFIHNVAPLIRKDKDDLLERVRRYIDEHISDENLTIPRIAAEMGMSRASFFSRFKELAGISPQDYLIHYRIAHARQQLSAGNMSVAEVAYRCGFSDPKYFSRAFKKIEGISPSALRTAH